MINFIHIILCLIGAGYAKGRLDYIADSGQKGDDWRNKYKKLDGNLVETKSHWWYFGLYKPTYDEYLNKLPYDLWHKQQTEDYYPTPSTCIEPFKDTIKYAEHILESYYIDDGMSFEDALNATRNEIHPSN